MTRVRSVLSIVSALIFFAVSAFAPSDHPTQPSDVIQPSGHGFFIQNVGQFQGGDFLLKGEHADFWFSKGELRVSQTQTVAGGTGDPLSKRETVLLTFDGSNPAAVIEPFGRLDTALSYLIGSEPENWRVNVPVWSGLRIRNLYDGVDLVINGAAPDGSLDWTLESQPGADLSAVQLKSSGAPLLVSADAELQLAGILGTIRLNLPAGAVAESQSESGGGGITSNAASLDSTVPSGSSLQATPIFNYLSFLGGSGQDKAYSVAAENGSAYVTGSTASTDFPITLGVVDTMLENTDAFVVKVNDAGTGLTYATFLGGNLEDIGNDIAVENGIAYITGRTNSTTFPGMSPWEDRDYEAFLVSLTTDGTGIRYAKRFGGSDVEKDEAFGIAVEAGNAYITGLTYSADFNGKGSSIKGDIFIIKVDSAGASKYTSILGGGSLDAGYDIAVSGGVAYITGESDSKFFMGVPAKYEAFVLKIDAVGGLDWKTVLSGGNSDRGNGIALDSSGNIYVAGATDSADFLSSLPAVLTYGGLDDAYIVRLDSSGTPNFRTFLGGSGHDRAFSLAMDGMGGVQVTGETYSTNFPVTTDAFGLTLSGSSDAFVARILPGNATPLSFSSYLGGTGSDFGRGLALDIRGATYLCGETASTDLAVTPSAFDTTYGGMLDGYIGKIPIGPVPGVVLKKYTNDSDADLPPGPYILKNGAVSWKYNIYNTGGSDLNSIVLSDNVLGTITCPLSSLAPGASMTCTATGTASAGQYENLGTVVAQPPGGLPVTDEDYSHYFGADPKITITATTAGLDGRVILVGQTAAITYVVKNTGNVPLGNITVTDTAGIVVTCPKSTLTSSEEMTCNSSMLVTTGTTSHTANVTADPPSGLSAISASDTTSHFGAAPSITLTNKVSLDNESTWNDSNTTPTSLMLLTGNTPKFQLSVTNNGNVALTNIAVTGCSTIANLAIGATSTPCVVTGTWESGEQQNLKSAAGSYTDGLGNIQALNSSDSAYYYGASPALTIQKEISLNNGSSWLDTTTGEAPTLLSGTDPQYRITVQNTGNVALLTTITDAYLNFGTSCQPTTLQPSGSQICTATKIWAANLQTNTAHGAASYSDSGSHTMNLDVSDTAKYFGASPALTFEKYVSVNGGATWLEADAATGPTLLSGHAAPQYKVTITNTGNVAVTGISVTDSALTLTGCAASFDLAVSGSKNCTVSAVWGTGHHENTASLSAAYTDSAAHTYPFALTDKAFYFGADPQLSVTKDVSVDGGATWLPADSAPGPYLLVGQDPPQFRFTLTNTGNVSLSATLSDSSITIPAPCATGMLAPSANRQCTVTGAWAAGSQVNTAQASASYSDTPGNLTNVSVSNQAYYYGAQPQLLLKKYVSGDGGTTWDDAETQPGPYFLGSVSLKYKLVFDNTGNVTLSGLAWSDPAFSLTGCTLPSSLTPEAAPVECILVGTWKAGQVDNLATAGGSYTDSAGHQTSPSDTDAAHYFGAQPGVSIVKTTQGQDANTTPGPNILVGDTVTWEYTITNTGNVPLTGIAVSDDNGTPLNTADDFTASCGSTGLAAGANQTCTASGTAIESQYENFGTISAQPSTGVVPIGLPLSNSDVSHYFGARISMTLEKTTNGIAGDNTPPGPFVLVGDPVTWSYKVTNTSNVPIGPLEIWDDNGTPLNPADDWQVCNVTNLASSHSRTCTTVPVPALAGQYANTGTVKTTYLGKNFSATDKGHYFGYVEGELLTLAVSLNNLAPLPPPGIYFLEGQEITFRYTVFNTSPSTITGVSLIDKTDTVEITCPANELTSGASMVCSRTISALAASHTHEAEVSGFISSTQHTGSASSTYFGVTPGLTIDVHTNGLDPTNPLDLPLITGTSVYWDYIVTNTSNVDLNNVTVVDDQGIEVTCPGTSLVLGGAMTCTGMGIATAGAYSNTGTVSGTPPGDLASFTAQADSYYYGVVPGVDLAVEINGSPASSDPGPEIIEGQTVTYTIDVSNTGNYRLETITVSLDGTPLTTCGTTLEAEAVMRCEGYETAVLGPQTRVITVSGTVNGETINAEKTVYYTGKEDLYYVFLPLILR